MGSILALQHTPPVKAFQYLPISFGQSLGITRDGQVWYLVLKYYGDGNPRHTLDRKIDRLDYENKEFTELGKAVNKPLRTGTLTTLKVKHSKNVHDSW